MFNTKNRSIRLARELRPKTRAGLTTLEIVGCTIAIAGGACLGAMYLGVDLRQAAHTALAETELLEKVPPDWRPVGPEDVETADQKAAKLRNEFDSLGRQISSLRGDSPPTAGVPAARSNPSNKASSVAAEQTIAYWNAVNQIAIDEATMQKDAEAAFDASNAARVFAIKARASRFAAKALAAIPLESKTDRGATKFAQELANWYENGADLYDRAVQIWESPIGATGRAHLNEDWNRAEVQHRNEARLIFEKATVLRKSLGRQFGVEFPDFAQPQDTEVPPTTKKPGAEPAATSPE